MDPSFIANLSCPYCGGSLRLSASIVEGPGRIDYGLAECRCFVFPIVEGILLLSLSKGYGGAEEALQPYVPLQAAAVHYLERKEPDALRAWIRAHVPLAAPFMGGNPGTYLEYSLLMGEQLEEAVARFLDDYSRYGAIWRKPSRRERLRQLRRRLSPPTRRERELSQLTQFYPARFFSPFAHATMMQLGQLPVGGRALSLCCGQGMFENLVRADGRVDQLTSMDGQFLNLLVTRHFVKPGGQFICHDLQLGLPFADGTFDGVFSSTCLPEIPAQRGFVMEAIRVTARSGWTWFDGIWNGEIGGARIDPTRYYRFGQNYFTRLDDYPQFFAECAGARRVSISLPRPPRDYCDGTTHWVHSDTDIAHLLASRNESQLNALVTDPGHFRGFPPKPERPWLRAETLQVSPVYDADARNGEIALRRRPQFANLASTFAMKAFGGYPASEVLSTMESYEPSALLERYCSGVLTLIPTQFDRASRSLARAWLPS